MEWGAILVALGSVVAIWLALAGVLVLAGRGPLAREVASLIPNLTLLFARLLGDARVPRRAKLALAVGAAYLAMPIDLVPDFIPVVGSLDDAIVVALVMRYVLRSTEPSVMRGHWRGEPRTLEHLLRAAGASRP